MEYGPDDIVFKPNPGAWYAFFIVSLIIVVFCLCYMFMTGVRMEDADYSAAAIVVIVLGTFMLLFGLVIAIVCRITRYVLTGTHLIVTELVGPGFPRKVTQEIAYDSITKAEEERPEFWYIWYVSSPLSLKQIKITYTEVYKGIDMSVEAFVVPKDRKKFLELLEPRLRSRTMIVRKDTKR